MDNIRSSLRRASYSICRASVIAAGLALICLLVSGCDSDSHSHSHSHSAPDSSASMLQGRVVNGPLNGADVFIYTLDGALLEQVTTNANGEYEAILRVRPPYRVEARGGTLAGNVYQGQLHALCETAECSVTPFTSVWQALVDRAGFNVGDAKAHMAGLLGFEGDPFLTDAYDSALFDIDAARAAIDGGRGLDAWVNEMVAWARDNAQPTPAGIPVQSHSYTVTPEASAGGSLSPSTPQRVPSGETTSFVVVAQEGFRIGSVSGCGGTLTGDTYTTGSIHSDCTVTADFEPADTIVDTSYTVTPVAVGAGQISPATPQQLASGATTTFAILPDEGHVVESITGCDGSLAELQFTLDPVAGDCEVRVVFGVVTSAAITVTADAGPGGSINPNVRTITPGDTTSFTVTPDLGHRIAAVDGCNGSLSGNTYTTGVITEACTVSADFALLSYTVSPQARSGGSISPATPLHIDYGGSASFTVTPRDGYRIASVVGCGGSLSGQTYTTSAITSDCDVIASFSLNTYTVTPSAGAGGSISPSATVTVDHNGSTSFTITPDAGYSIDSVSGCDGTLVGNVYTTGAITGACGVNADFRFSSIPQGLFAFASEGMVELTWDAAVGADDYCVYVGQSADISPSTAASYDIDLSGCGHTDPNAVITGLTNDTLYYFVVTARATGTESGASSRVSARPQVLRLLNDTGINWCDVNQGSCAETTNLGQDGHWGRDAMELTKKGGGAAGFDFTRICNSGEAEGEGDCPANMTSANIGDGANQWACTVDNVTGLMWEVKSPSSEHLRYHTNVYQWKDNNRANWGGTDYAPDGGANCNDIESCTTGDYETAVNESALCGYTDWRVPTVAELLSIVHNGRANTVLPAADLLYFPHTKNGRYWTSSSYAGDLHHAWYVNFRLIDVGTIDKAVDERVRLVRALE